MPRRLTQSKGLLWLVGLLVASILSACSRGGQIPTASPSAGFTSGTPSTPHATTTLTPFLPTATSEPLAAQVNGTGIPLEEYQAELARYKAAAGTDLAPADQKRVLDDLIDQTLLAQAAAEKGFVADAAMLQEHIDRLQAQMGSAQGLAEWMAANGYVEDSFRRDLSRSIAAAWMRDQIAASVPQQAEQVHVRQILLTSPERANEVYGLLQAGQDFDKLAANNDPISEGDLGWFPRGYLPDPALEEAAFNLQPGAYSGVIQTNTGYHILKLIERDPQRPLSPAARLALQGEALQKWLEQRRSQSDIQVFVP